jgi:hypothetical protein
MESGLMVLRTLTGLTGGLAAGLVLGAAIPIVRRRGPIRWSAHRVLRAGGAAGRRDCGSGKGPKAIGYGVRIVYSDRRRMIACRGLR